MPRTCSEPNCTQNSFGGGKCKYHQWKRRLKGGDLYGKSKQNESVGALSPKSDTIHRRTPKRAKDERYYSVEAKEFFEEAVKSKTNDCFFCGLKVNTFQGLHHWRGRTNQYLLDKQWWSIVHNSCHTDKWHRMTLEQIQKEGWYPEFLIRLKEKDPIAYEKQIGKSSKNILFKDEDFE
jgi:hypothetical protein